MVGGYIKSADCGAKRSGVAIVWVAEVADVDEFTLNNEGEDWSAVTMTATNKFKKYEFMKGEAELKTDTVVENGAGKATHSVEFRLEKMSQTSRDAVQELTDKSSCGLILIVQTNQGDKWVLGYDSVFGSLYYCELQTGTGTSGRALTDSQGFTVTLGNETVELARTFTGTVPV